MDVGHVILSRLWLFDLDVTIRSISNSCSFMYKGKKILFNPFPPKPFDVNHPKTVVDKKGVKYY